MARAGAARPGGMGAGAHRGRAARGDAHGRRGAAAGGGLAGRTAPGRLAGRGRWSRRRRSASGVGRCSRWPSTSPGGRPRRSTLHRARRCCARSSDWTPARSCSLERGDPAPGPRAGTAQRLPGRQRSARTAGLLPYEAEDAESFFGRDADVAACLTRLRPGRPRRRRPVGHRQVVAGSGRRRRRPAARRRAVGGHHARASPPDSLESCPSRPACRCWSSTRARRRSPCAPTRPSGRGTSSKLDESLRRRAPSWSAPRRPARRAVANRGFARLVERGLYLLSPMSEDDLRAAIEGPARQAGLPLEPGLVDLARARGRGRAGRAADAVARAAADVGATGGPTLTVEGYRATGGIRDAVPVRPRALHGSTTASGPGCAPCSSGW